MRREKTTNRESARRWTKTVRIGVILSFGTAACAESLPPDPAQWLHSVSEREPSHNDFRTDSGAATSVCQQSLSDSLPGKHRGPRVELRSVYEHQSTTTGNTTILLRTQDSVNVRCDFQIAPKDTGLQRFIISAGQVCDRGNIITFALVERYSTSSLATESSLRRLVVCIV